MTTAAKRSAAFALTAMLAATGHATATLEAPKTVDIPKPRIFDDPMSGVVINRTVTVLGNDFYQYFAMAWREKDTQGQWTISVHERPSARFGSEIWVQFRQNRVFHAFLSPARQAAKRTSEQAAEIAFKNIMDSEVQRMLFQSQDLGAEEL